MMSQALFETLNLDKRINSVHYSIFSIAGFYWLKYDTITMKNVINGMKTAVLGAGEAAPQV